MTTPNQTWGPFTLRAASPSPVVDNDIRKLCAISTPSVVLVDRRGVNVLHWSMEAVVANWALSLGMAASQTVPETDLAPWLLQTTNIARGLPPEQRLQLLKVTRWIDKWHKLAHLEAKQYRRTSARGPGRDPKGLAELRKSGLLWGFDQLRRAAEAVAGQLWSQRDAFDAFNEVLLTLFPEYQPDDVDALKVRVHRTTKRIVHNRGPVLLEVYLGMVLSSDPPFTADGAINKSMFADYFHTIAATAALVMR